MKTIARLVATLSILASTAVAAHAQVVTPNPAPTIITTAPYTITKPGFYQLGANLTATATTGSIITINASNVTLDFAGHYISGPSSPSAISGGTLYGVSAYEEGNLNIQNGTIAYCYDGVHITGSGNAGSININQQVTNLLVSYCSRFGISIENATNCLVANNRISFIGGTTVSGISVAGVDLENETGGNTAQNNVISTVTAGGLQGFGIVGDENNLTVTGNRVSNVTGTTYAIGICYAVFAETNKVATCSYGIYECLKYADTLTSNCTTPFSGGTAVGSTNN